MQITSEQVDGTLVLRLAGDPDLSAGEQMESAVVRAVASKPGKVVIDLSGLQFIGSAVAGRMVALQSQLKRAGGRAVIASPTKTIREALERMRVVSVIPIFDTVEQAMSDDGTAPAPAPETQKSRMPWSSGR